MMKAASIFLCKEIHKQDIQLMIGWKENPNIIRYLNEEPHIVTFLQNLLYRISKDLLEYYFNRKGSSF